ncbi:MAG: adenosylcobinamide-GDP ribazoletransferase, partial [Thermodesulfobacteriota bacterium]
MKSFFLALRFLTILPLGGNQDLTDSRVASAGKYYPLVGLIIGALLWAFYRGIGVVFPVPVAVALLLIFWVLITGALHLDGLADCLDGLYGGNRPEERLRIMKDVHLGTMGIVGLVIILGMKFLLFKELLLIPSQGVWLFLVPSLSRWTPIFLSCFFPYARPGGGLGSALVTGTGKKELFWATLL